MIDERRKTIAEKDILAFQKGDKNAFEIVYKHYYKRIFFFAKSHVKNDALAEDVVQNTFISVCKSIGNLKNPGAFHSWIMQITYRECMNIYSRKKLPIKDVEDGDIDIFSNVDVKDMSDSLEDQVLLETIMKSIANLKQIYQEVAVLKYLDDLTDEESANVLNIPVGTVKSRLSKVRDILQRDLTKEGMTPQTYRMSAPAITALLSGALVYAEQAGSIPIVSSQLLTFVTGVKHSSALIKGILGVSAATTLVATVYFVQQPKPEKIVRHQEVIKEEIVPEVIPQTAKLNGISYDTAYTNGNVELQFDVSEGTYDKVLVNNQETTTVTENGTYTVTLWNQDQLIDTKDVVISNIDREAPIYTTYTKDGTTCYVYVGDGLSGIDMNQTLYYKNEQLSRDFYYDATAGTIVFTYDEFSSNIFEVYDVAGNKTKVTLVSKYYGQ